MSRVSNAFSISGPKLGECPVWCRTRAGPLLDRYLCGQPQPLRSRRPGATASGTLPEPIGSFALCEPKARRSLALKSGLYRFDLEARQLTPLARPRSRICPTTA